MYMDQLGPGLYGDQPGLNQIRLTIEQCSPPVAGFWNVDWKP